eukprot:11781447-Karenia_brevis.AAC.1
MQAHTNHEGLKCRKTEVTVFWHRLQRAIEARHHNAQRENPKMFVGPIHHDTGIRIIVILP